MTNIQTWPLNIDFTIAVQNPHLCFSDPDLKQSSTAKNSRGRVLLWSGNFATVYKLTKGDRAWAVRCFTRVPQSDVQQRYSLISEHLQQHPIPYLVNFEFIAQGILVGGSWYPILKMDWVEGTEIDRYIGEYIDNSQVLLRLDRQLQQLRQDLQEIGIAHGDLQHGNIMVDEAGELKLVDYDGMYVPALEGKPPLEVGHPNYQPPHRSTEDFSDRLDEFSFEVISLSLRALANQPDLWKNFHEDNKNLIFRQNDFQEPDQSPVFQSINKIDDDQTRELCDRLIMRCQGKNESPTTLQLTIPKTPVVLIGLLVALLTVGGTGYWLWRSQPIPPQIASPSPPPSPTNQVSNSPTSTVEPTASRSPEASPTEPPPLKPIKITDLLARYATGQRDFRGMRISGDSSDRLQGKNLQNTDLRGSVIERVDLREAFLQNANLDGVTIIRTDFRGANLSNASLVDANLSLSNLVGVNLSQANLLRANLFQVKLNSANLQRAELTKANLQEADLSAADLSSANLILTDLQRANLLKTNLRNSNLGAANLNNAVLEGADLSMANLRSAELELTNLSNANLSNADLTAAKLVLIEFAGTNLTETNFYKAIVENIGSVEAADFTNVTNLDPKIRQYFCSLASGNVTNSDITTKSTLNCP